MGSGREVSEEEARAFEEELLLGLASDHDRWRDLYDDLTFDDQKVVYSRIRELYPNQRSFTVNRAYEFFRRYRPQSVTELGGWDGFLAACVLGQHPEIRSWVNYDLTAVVQSCIDPRYSMIVLDSPVWIRKPRLVADAFVATHTIEHIKLDELEKVVGALEVKFCLIEAPLLPYPTDWTGHPSTHVIEGGWDAVDEIFKGNGYEPDYSWTLGRYYVR